MYANCFRDAAQQRVDRLVPNVRKMELYLHCLPLYAFMTCRAQEQL